MKKTILLSAICLMFVAYGANASSKYRVNDAAVEAAFSLAKPVATTMTAAKAMMTPVSDQKVLEDKNPWIAVILDLLIGGLAIHRVYLGGTPVLIIGYLFTFGGIFGLVPFIDLIVLIVNNQDISKYVGSNKFFMW